MHLLVRFENIRAAYALADYLNTMSIQANVRQVASGGEVYIHHQEDLARAAEELKLFVANPQDKKYLSASWEQDGTSSRPGIDDVYRDSSNSTDQRWRNTGLFTKAIIAICVIVFVLTSFGGDRSMVRYFYFFTYWGQMQDFTQVYRWVTPVFLHFGLLHITFNLLWWWDIASLIERLQGAARLFGVFMVLAVVPNYAQFLWSGNKFGGLSGVVYGVLGYVWIYGRVRKDYPLQLRPVIIYMMVGWMLIGFAGVFDQVIGPMANLAHLGGLVAGVVLGVYFALKDMALKKEHKRD